MKQERNGGHGKEGVCACVFRQVREKGLIVGLAAHVLHLEEIASLAHLSPLPSAVISIAKSKLADLKNIKTQQCLFYVFPCYSV